MREAFLRDCNVRTLKVMPGLSETHLDPNSFEKMRVSLAFQLFGTSVLRGMSFTRPTLKKYVAASVQRRSFLRKLLLLSSVYLLVK